MNPLWLIVILPAAVFLICLPQLIWPPNDPYIKQVSDQ
jgi:hypothetical protein